MGCCSLLHEEELVTFRQQLVHEIRQEEIKYLSICDEIWNCGDGAVHHFSVPAALTPSFAPSANSRAGGSKTDEVSIAY